MVIIDRDSDHDDDSIIRVMITLRRAASGAAPAARATGSGPTQWQLEQPV